MLWMLGALTALLTLLTLLPLSRSQRWWVRGWDFPRLQLLVLGLLLVLAALFSLNLSRTGSWALILIALACSAYQAVWILPYTCLYPKEVKRAPAQAEPVADLCILNANVLTPNHNAEGLLRQVRAQRPDLLITLESNAWWQARLDALQTGYPHALKCPLDNLYGMHLYSRYPLEEAQISYLVEPDVPSMHVLVRLPSGQGVRLHCLHPRPPAPAEDPSSGPRDAELIVVGKSLQDDDSPAIVAGDLNDVAWSATTRLFRKVSGMLDPRVGRGMFNTFHAGHRWVRWPLDHLFHSDHFTLVHIERLDAFGSDHFPILVKLALTPRAGAGQEGLPEDKEAEVQAQRKARAEGAGPEDVPEPGE